MSCDYWGNPPEDNPAPAAPPAGRPLVTVEVRPSGRWSWYVVVSVSPPAVPGGPVWIAHDVRAGHVLGTRRRADRIASRWLARERAWQQRLQDDTHQVDA